MEKMIEELEEIFNVSIRAFGRVYTPKSSKEAFLEELESKFKAIEFSKVDEEERVELIFFEEKNSSVHHEQTRKNLKIGNFEYKENILELEKLLEAYIENYIANGKANNNCIQNLVDFYNYIVENISYDSKSHLQVLQSDYKDIFGHYKELGGDE